MRPTRALLVGLTAAASAAHPWGAAGAQTLGVAPVSTPQVLRLASAYTLGYAFNVTAPVTVTYLGYHVGLFGDLRADHQVGIWDSAGTLLASALVPAGRDGLVVNSFRLVPLGAPLTLGVGTNYTVGGFEPAGLFTGDAPFAGDTERVTAPGVEFVEGRYLLSAEFGAPVTASALPGGIYGGNFAVGATTVPEPGTVVLLGAGLGLLVGAARRTAKTRTPARPARPGTPG